MNKYFDISSINPDDEIIVRPTNRLSGKQIFWAMRGNEKTQLYYQMFKDHLESTGTDAVDNI